VLGKIGCSGFEYLDWVLQRVKEIHRVGASCVGFEKEFMALLTVIEASRSPKVSSSSSKHGNKGSRELKRL
jgi:hypothetical protein